MSRSNFQAKRIALTITFILFLILEQSYADIIFSVDLDPNVSGIQNARTVSAATQFQVDLYLELTNSTSLDTYRTSVMFDNPGLTFVSGTPLPLSNYSRQAGLPALSGNNVFGPFEASSNSLGAGLTGPQGPFLIGNLIILASNSPGIYTIKPFETNLDGSFDNGFNPLTPTFRNSSVTVSAIPEPNSAAIILCILGCGAARRLLHRRRMALSSC